VVQAVGVLAGDVTGDLAHGPELPAVHRGIDAAGVRKLARVAELLVVAEAAQVLGGIKRLDWHPRDGAGRLGRLPGAAVFRRCLAAHRHLLALPMSSAASAYRISVQFGLFRSRPSTGLVAFSF